MLATLALCSCASGGRSLGTLQVRPASVAAPAQQSDAYADAKRQLALGNFALAVDGFRKAIRAEPQSAAAYNGLAVAYDRIGRTDLSRDYYEQALALAPRDADILHNLALSLASKGKMPAAVAHAALPAAPAAGLRLERISTREIALITRRAGNGWEAVDADDAPRLAVTGQPFFAQSHDGSLEIALEPPAIQPVAKASATPPVSVTVLNAVGRRGLARRMSKFLGAKGWNSGSIGNARIRPMESVMFHAPRDRLAAVALARVLPFPSRLVVMPTAPHMILFVGRNALPFDQRLRSAQAS
ncbi:LytR C-terminal domain-containing protein [Rhizorhabdus argentea]|uniref:LytR C-terminal domain-containing protein n=1 Tax=Rhizorhabdus argentea TaxID=1387174 RepID=UPI0030EECB8C